VWIDDNSNGRLDAEERYTRVGLDGSYRLPNVPVGNYELRASMPRGFWRTSPGNGLQRVSLSRNGQTVNRRDFGMTDRAFVRVSVFEDYDFNGQINGYDQPLVGVRVFLDRDGDGEYDRGERIAYTNASGAAVIRDLGPGPHYIGVLIPRTWAPTTSPVQRILLAAGQLLPSKLNFGIRT
jgi:hypothetical protein